MARPKKNEGDKKARFLQVRIDDLEKASFDQAASFAGLDVSAWVRTRLRELAKTELEANGKKVPFITGKKPSV